MKRVRFKKLNNTDRGRKFMSIKTLTEDKECTTNVRKRFLYNVERVEEPDANVQPPEIFINKFFDSQFKVEKFSFQVIGCFYMTHKRKYLKVNFHHALNIRIDWKNKNFSPKKSAVLA